MSQTNCLFKLTESTLLLVKGPDAAKFLQGQVTCDIRELTEPVTRLGAHCTPKGRVIFSFRALQFNEHTIALRLPASMLENAKTALGKYAVFSKTKLDTAANEFSLYGIYGPEAKAALVHFFATTPNENDAWVSREGSYVIQLAENRFECWIKTESTQLFLDSLNNSATDESCNDWQLLDIQAGIAEIYPETQELFTPQEINYQLINGVSFRKGCYTGQEIVARLHYKGKLKRHLFRFAINKVHNMSDVSKKIAPGTTLVNSQTGNTQGHVVMTAHKNGNDATLELLASVLADHLDQLQIASSTEKLALLPLPYAIPTTDE